MTGVLQRRFRPRLRPGRDRPDHDRPRHAAADPARQRHARRAASGATSWPPGRVGEFLPDRGDRDLPRRQRQLPSGCSRCSRWVPWPCCSRSCRGWCAADGSPDPGRGEHATSQTTLRWTVVAAVRAARRGRGLRPGRRAGRVPRRRRAAPVGARGRARAGGEARRRRLRLLHPGVLRLLGHGPRHRLHRRGARRLLAFFLLLLVVRGLPALVLLPPRPRRLRSGSR